MTFNMQLCDFLTQLACDLQYLTTGLSSLILRPLKWPGNAASNFQPVSM